MKLLNLFLCLIISGFTQNALAQDITTRTERFEANTVSIVVQIDTFEVLDPVTGDVFIKLEKREKIQKLNGKDIYYDDQATEPVGAAAQSTLKEFISRLVNDELKNAKNVHNMDIVIDEKGNLGFIRFQFFRHDKDAEKAIEPIRKKIIEILKGVKFIPAKKDGKAVPYGTAIMPIK